VALYGLAWVPQLRGSKKDEPPLRQQLWGRSVSNPIGLAAGLDKDAVAVAGLARLGFGVVEIGSVTPRPQPGNPKPRLFRLAEDQAVINRMGFNSAGHEVVFRRLDRYRAKAGNTGPLIGVNLGKNRESEDPAVDYAAGVVRFSGVADYLVVNISSPNTPGLRSLQSAEPLRLLLDRLAEARGRAGLRPPLLLKLAPDLSGEERAIIAETAIAYAVDGLVVSKHHHYPAAGTAQPAPHPVRRLERETAVCAFHGVLADFARLTQGRLTLIGVGGVASGADVYAKIRAGASLVQLYTALIYDGPGPRAPHQGRIGSAPGARWLWLGDRCDRQRPHSGLDGEGTRVIEKHLTIRRPPPPPPWCMSSSEIPLVSGLSELAELYEGFILDLWGVLHDGVAAFPGAIDCLKHLRSAGKHVAILSNAPRRAAEVASRSAELGITPDLYDIIHSSGEETWLHLKERPDAFHRSLGRACFHLGPDRDRGVLDGLDLIEVGHIEEANFVLNTGAHMAQDEADDFEPLLQPAAERKLPMICANPDLEVIRGGVREICAGTLALRYEELGRVRLLPWQASPERLPPNPRCTRAGAGCTHSRCR
jgi:dihydroorotate dehydrogenase